MIRHISTIILNEKVTDRFWHMKIDAGKLVEKVQPGQFIDIKIEGNDAPFFRRPFSIYRAKDSIEILYDVVGAGTKLLSGKKKGDKIDFLGPLGNGFSLPDKRVKDVYMIAGGVGVAPFLALSDKLKERNINLNLLYGGRTSQQIADTKPFRQNKCDVFIATDDGSCGIKGRVSKLFGKIQIDAQSTYIYVCGPRLMTKAVYEFVSANKLKAEASLEEVMACGVGACLGCSTKTNDGYKTVCCQGPVFRIDQIVFE